MRFLCALASKYRESRNNLAKCVQNMIDNRRADAASATEKNADILNAMLETDVRRG